MGYASPARRKKAMKCVVQGCPGEMEERRIVHTFVRDGKPLVVEDLPALVCPICGYTVLDLRVLDALFALDPKTDPPVGQAPVFRLSATPV
jgi:YgiT-type zinc finger domain-containing protein